MPMQAPAPSQPNIFGQSAGAYGSAIGAANRAAAGSAPMVGTSFGYNPGSVGTSYGYSPQQVAAEAAYGGMANYQNPFTQQVIDTSMADLERQRQMQMGQMGAQATAAGAFGGSRHGVAEALTNQGFAQQGGQLASGLRMQGFNTALGAAQADAAARMQAAMANQGAGARAQEFGQQSAMQAALANQAAQARAAEFGQSSSLQAQMANQSAGLQGQQLGLSAAGQLGNLANLGFNMGQSITQQQAAQGQQQQLMNQALIDAGRAQYGGFTGAPQQSLANFLAALGGSQTDQRTTTETQRPGLLQYLTPILGGL